MKNTKGITLVALVITIVILLILAEISIQAITQTNLFDKTKQARNATENAQKEENRTLSTYTDKINEYLPETLLYKVKNGEIAIGSYVNYEPDTLDENKLATLKNNLNTYSGVANDENNTINPAIKRDNLKWRVLDIDEKTGGVRLISAETTDSIIQLYGYNGYNNAVKLIDDACSTLYNNNNLTSKVQNLKIEDITKYLKEQQIENTTEYTPTNINYPKILEQDKNQTVEKSSITNKLNESEQNIFVTGNDISSTSTLRKTSWTKIFTDDDFLNYIYYELYINNGENYPTYWIASRCIDPFPNLAIFNVRSVYNSGVATTPICYSYNGDQYPFSYALRPVITLNSNLQLDTENPGEGTENNAYNIKL